MYDVTSRSTFDNIKDWLELGKSVLKESNENILSISSDIVQVLCANKIDLECEREVSAEEGEILASELNMEYRETSALENLGISDMFTYIGE